MDEKRNSKTYRNLIIILDVTTTFARNSFRIIRSFSFGTMKKWISFLLLFHRFVIKRNSSTWFEWAAHIVIGWTAIIDCSCWQLFFRWRNIPTVKIPRSAMIPVNLENSSDFSRRFSWFDLFPDSGLIILHKWCPIIRL